MRIGRYGPRLLILQTGDFREAHERLASGGAETFHDQRKSVDFVAGLAGEWSVHVASAASVAYVAELAPGLEASGWPGGVWQTDMGKALFERHRPDAVICRTPNEGLIAAAGAGGVACLPCFADVFQPATPWRRPGRAELRRAFRNHRFRKALDWPSVVACGNHGLAAARSLHAVLGVPLERCIPWEWSVIAVPPRRHGLSKETPSHVLYAGTLVEAKGILELVAAVALLERRGVSVRLDVAGDGPDRKAVEALIACKGLEKRVSMLGRIPKEEVRKRMQDADIVSAPSRIDYAEGLPNSLVEGLALGTPLVLTDHPAIAGRVRHEETAMIVPERDPGAIANAIARLVTEPELYRRIVANSETAYRSLFVGASWYAVVSAFLTDPTNRGGWVWSHSLASLQTSVDGHMVVAARNRDAAPTDRNWRDGDD